MVDPPTPGAQVWPHRAISHDTMDDDRSSYARWIPLVLAALYVVFRLVTAPALVNAETGEKHRVAFTEAQESAVGLQSYREVLRSAHVVEHGESVDLVKRVARRLTQVVHPSVKGYDWRVSVVESPQRNAFCLPGGKMVVYTGILPVAEGEAGLATVLGHEIAHATSHHGGQRVFRDQSIRVLLMGAQASLGDMDAHRRETTIGLLGAGARFGLALPFSREHELEADRIGLFYMARAGYDPRESIRFWQRMMAASKGGRPPELMSTHPANETRIHELTKALPVAEAQPKLLPPATPADAPVRPPPPAASR